MSTGLPLVVVTTVDGEEPAFDLAYPPEGSSGKGITNATKVPGRVMVILRGQARSTTAASMRRAPAA